VHWIGGEKGGVGKSVVARLLVQYWIDRAIDFRAFDTDRSHGALLRYYSGYAEPLDPTRLEELDRIVDAIDEPVEEVVVDLAAQTEADVEAWLTSGDVIPLFQRLGHEIWWWYVIDDGKDSVRLLSRLLDRLDDPVHLVCVRNLGRGRDFMLFDEAKLQERILQRGGDVIEIPELHARSMLKMDAYDKSFWAAIHNVDPEEGPCLARMERERAKVFIRKAHDAFRAVLNPSSS
jgi:hypothetical protein